MLSKPPLPRGEPLLNVKPIKLWRLNQPKGDPLITGGCCWLRFALHPNPNLRVTGHLLPFVWKLNQYLVGGATTILKNMTSSMGRMTSHI